MEISSDFSAPGRRSSSRKRPKPVFACLTAILGVAAAAPACGQQRKEAPPPMELSRTVRPWEFLPVTGQRSALFANEAGATEVWVYPLKLFREFHLNFLTQGRVLPAEALARTLTVRPESTALLYAGDARRHLPRLERAATCVLFWRGTREIRRVCRLSHRNRCSRRIPDQLFGIRDQFVPAGAHGKGQRDKTHCHRRFNGRPHRGREHLSAFDRGLRRTARGIPEILPGLSRAYGQPGTS